MHLSSKELAARWYADLQERGKRRATSLFRPGAVVHSDERPVEAAGAGSAAQGGSWRTAEFHPAMVGYAQWRADRALWSAAEPVPIAGWEAEYEELYPR